MEADSFFPSEFTNYEYIYNNENSIAQLQVPLSISYFNVPKFANELYTDTDTTYFTYSGDWSSLIVSREKDGRYKNLSMRAYSGDSFKFYFSTGLGFSSGENYYSGPVTISGSYSKLTSYSGEAAAIANAITFMAPSGNSSVFTLPFVENINWIRLHHKSAVSGQAYRLYQFLPRTLIQVDDLEADVIDAVTVRVSGSIVVTADSFADGSITGEKIMAGTVSGVLITPGTITANEISAGAITANKLNVTQLSAITSNMGELFVTEKLEVTSGYLSAGISRIDNTGIQIGSLNTSLSATDALRIYGSGAAGNIVGMAFYNGSYSAINPQITIQADSTNALEIENNAINGLTNFNFPTSGLANSAAVNIYNGNLYLRKSPNPPANEIPGTIYGTDSDGTERYKLGPDQLVLNNNTENTFTVNANNGTIYTLGNIHVGSGEHVFTVNGTTGNLHVGAPPHVFRVNGGSGDTHIAGTLDVVENTRVEGDLLIGAAPAVASITSTTGAIQTDGNITSQANVYGATVTATTDLYGEDTLNVANDGAGDYRFKVSSTGKLTSDAMGYITVRRTADVAITTAGTVIVWQSATRSNNISFSTDTITIANAGYYTFSATFATVANLTSLRMTLTRGTVNYVSTLHGAGLSTGGGYLFNFNIGFFASAGSTYKVTLTPSANTTLNANNEGFAGPSPILNIFQAIGV